MTPNVSDQLARIEEMLQRLLDVHGITGGHAGPSVSAITPRTAIPTTLTAGELMQALNLKPWVFFKLQRAGKFKRFEFRRPIGHKRYSGRLVAAYLEQG